MVGEANDRRCSTRIVWFFLRHYSLSNSRREIQRSETTDRISKRSSGGKSSGETNVETIDRLIFGSFFQELAHLKAILAKHEGVLPPEQIVHLYDSAAEQHFKNLRVRLCRVETIGRSFCSVGFTVGKEIFTVSQSRFHSRSGSRVHDQHERKSEKGKTRRCSLSERAL